MSKTKIAILAAIVLIAAISTIWAVFAARAKEAREKQFISEIFTPTDLSTLEIALHNFSWRQYKHCYIDINGKGEVVFKAYDYKFSESSEMGLGFDLCKTFRASIDEPMLRSFLDEFKNAGLASIGSDSFPRVIRLPSPLPPIGLTHLGMSLQIAGHQQTHEFTVDLSNPETPAVFAQLKQKIIAAAKLNHRTIDKKKWRIIRTSHF